MIQFIQLLKNCHQIFALTCAKDTTIFTLYFTMCPIH